MPFEMYDRAAQRRSRSAFIAMAAFWFSATKFLLSGVVLRISEHYSFNFGTTDAGLLGAFLAPCLALYLGRRHSDKALSGLEPGNNVEKGEPE
jgi:hypothetical protein